MNSFKESNPAVEIKTIMDKVSILGEQRKEGFVAVVHKGVADKLIAEKKAVLTNNKK